MIEDRLTFFDQAITKIRAGEALESVLRDMPDDPELIQSIQVAFLLKTPIPLPNPLAQQSSKQAFLSTARTIKGESKKIRFWDRIFGLRLATQLLIISIVLIASLTISGLVSAQSLPGQPLYSFKRTVEKMQLALTRDALGRLQLEEVLDARRVNEVIRLQQSGKNQTVSFAGWLAQDQNGVWSVQGVPLIMDQESPLWNALLNGAYIEVDGISQKDGVLVRTLELRMFYMNGKLQLNSNGQWMINGIQIRVSNQSQLFTPLRDGVNVNATAIRLNSEEYLILVLSADDKESRESNNENDSNISTDLLSGSNRGTSSGDDGESETQEQILSTAIATMTLQETEKPDDDEFESSPRETGSPTITPDEIDDGDNTPEPDDNDEDPTDQPNNTPTPNETPEPTDTPEEDD